MSKTTLAIRKDYTYSYHDQSIDYTIWLSPGTEKITIIIFLGTIQIGNAVRWVAESCPPGTVVVQGVPHWFASADDGSDIPEFVFTFTECAFKQILKDFPVTTINIIAESQGVPGVIRLFCDKTYEKYLGGLVLIQPLGLTMPAFGDSHSARAAALRQRVRSNLRHQVAAIVLDRRLRHIQRNMIKMVNLRDAKTTAQYASGLAYDSLHDLRLLLTMHPDVYVIAGARDKVFPAHELEASFLKAGVDISVDIVPDVPHSLLATQLGAKLLRQAFVVLGQKI